MAAAAPEREEAAAAAKGQEGAMAPGREEPERPELSFEEEDVQHEEEILRNPFSVRCWLRYIQARHQGPPQRLNLLFERALRELPGSYKLWYQYLRQRRQQVKGRCPTDPAFEEANACHERALVFMHKMPRIWLDYCQFLVDQGRITRTRRTFDRALRALPITQHHRVWPLYLSFVRRYPLPETAVRVYRRFLKLSPESAEEFVGYLRSVGRLDEAAARLARLVNDERFVSKEGKSNYQLWQELCELLSQHPERIRSLDAGAIIRGGLTRFTDQLGRLWGALADCYIRSGHFEKARDVYEEAVQTVMTVRDFTQVFDSYAQFEESVIAAKMETVAELGKEEDEEVELELRLARFEQLMARRPLLLNSVLLRQNPHNVHEWHKRVQLYQGRPEQIIQTYTEAVRTVDPFKATGRPHGLWVAFARFYEDNGQLEDARTILTKATRVRFRQVEDLAAIWCEFGEMELRHENHDEALRILRKATALPAKRAEYFDSSEPVQNRLYKSLKVWSMLADLEESLGTFQSTKAVYDRILDLRIATPQIVINYGLFLEEHGYFEESFKPSTCCTRSWRSASGWPVTPWGFTTAPPAPSCPPSSTTCSTSTSNEPPSSTASPTRAPSTRKPSRSWGTTLRASSACASPTWSASSGRWIEREPSTPTARRSATPASRAPSGRPGRTLRSVTGTRTRSGRCCGSSAASRPPTTRRSTSWPPRCSRSTATPPAPCRTWPRGRAGWTS
ncbi:pre-mRNA-splicing factor SYF1 isoform X2 [Phaenicophaeus curvirostris]|uniref:pre-mRNA-splicing factor SYF1 isoform X2 n=1 Tax=Phaenicophaeus curvirostris TaxID=33595 RepID=UPI0037F0DFE8